MDGKSWTLCGFDTAPQQKVGATKGLIDVKRSLLGKFCVPR